MYSKWHLIVSLIVAIFSVYFDQRTPFLEILLLGGEITVFILCIVVGMLVDGDHIIDYWVIRGHMSKSARKDTEREECFLCFTASKTL